jgi:pSer/pThr/pTyr-binding forkhead associated (FHA) protein
MAVVDLVVLNGSRSGACFGIPEVPIVVGRSAEANIHIDDPWISNMHALIERRGVEIWVVDLGSRNGTYVDDLRVAEARVDPGTVLAFGQTRLELRKRTAASARDSEPMKTPVRRHPVGITVPHQASRRPSSGGEPASTERPAGHSTTSPGRPRTGSRPASSSGRGRH